MGCPCNAARVGEVLLTDPDQVAANLAVPPGTPVSNPSYPVPLTARQVYEQGMALNRMAAASSPKKPSEGSWIPTIAVVTTLLGIGALGAWYKHS
jgi:hypothetical protein